MWLATRDLHSSVEDRASTRICRIAMAPYRAHMLVELTSLLAIGVAAFQQKF
jgi:hypothetical protein